MIITTNKNIRSPRSCYSCTCDEKCLEKGLVLCTLDKLTRYKCKHCRYKKCMDLTGMRPQWVIQQYIPKVEKEKNKETAASKGTKTGDEEVKILKYKSFVPKNYFISAS